MFEGLKQEMVLAGVRWAVGIVSGSVALFAFSHTEIMAWVQKACALMSNQQAMETGLPAFAVAVATLAWSLANKKTQADKVTTAAVTQSAEAANDPQLRKDVVAAVKSGEIPVPTIHQAVAPTEDLSDRIATMQARARGE